MVETTPLGAVVRGLIAGVAGVAAMDALWYRRYRQGGGTSAPLTWEFSSSAESWDQAPAPAQVGQRLYEVFTREQLRPGQIALVNNIVHWGYGLSWAALYGIVAGSSRERRAAGGVVFGALVWLSGYAVLPLAKIYKPMWAYDRETLSKDLSAHLVYGATAGAVFRLLAGKRHR